MKLNIMNSILVLVLSIVACSASSSKTIPTSNGSKTIPTSSSKIIPTSTKIITTTIKSTKTITTTTVSSNKTYIEGENGYFTTSINVNYGSTMLVLPNIVADVKMTCYPPKGLGKRDISLTKTIPSSSKVIPNTIISSSSTNINTITKSPPAKTTTRSLYPWEIYADYIANEPITQGDYTLYRSYGGMTVCKIYTRPYPITTVTFLDEPIRSFKTYTTSIRHKAIIDILGDEITTTAYKKETYSYGYTDTYTRINIPLTITSRDQSGRDQFDNYQSFRSILKNNYKVHCTSSEVSDPKIPYVETITYETPIDYVTSNVFFGVTSTTTFLDMKTTYVTSYSSGAYTYTKCKLETLTQPPVITTTTSTKQPPVITTTTTTEESPVITTTTSTKQPPVITTTTTTTEQVKSTKCIPAVITVTEKEKVTVTEKETVTVTVTKNGPVQTSDNDKCAKKWAQCGGVGFKGPTCCESGSTCKELNQYYSQCI